MPVVKIPPIQPKQSNNDTGFADSFVAQVINRTSSNSTNIPIEQANLITEKVAPHKLTALDGIALKPKSKSKFADSFIPQVINRTNNKQNSSLEETSSLAPLKPKSKSKFDQPTHKIQFKDLENKPLELKSEPRATFTLKQSQLDQFDPIQSQAAVNSNKKRSPQIENNSTTPDLQTFPTSIAEAKQAILSTIAGWAQDIPGYYLLRVILGKDLITKESIPRNAANIIRGVISLIPGGERLYQQMNETGAIDRGGAWLDKNIAKLNLTWENVSKLMGKAWDSLSLWDFRSPSKVFGKIKKVFLPLTSRIINFAKAAGNKLLEFILEGALKLAGPPRTESDGSAKRGRRSLY